MSGHSKWASIKHKKVLLMLNGVKFSLKLLKKSL